MPESRQIVFKHKEVVEALLRQQNIRESIWGLFVRFGIQGANVGTTPADLMPAAIVPLLEIGLQKFEQESNIAVDAAKVGPDDVVIRASVDCRLQELEIATERSGGWPRGHRRFRIPVAPLVARAARPEAPAGGAGGSAGVSAVVRITPTAPCPRWFEGRWRAPTGASA